MGHTVEMNITCMYQHVTVVTTDFFRIALRMWIRMPESQKINTKEMEHR